jgi:hypothetical protein
VNSVELRRVPPLGWLAAGLLAQKLLPGGRRANRTSLGPARVILSACLGLLGWAVASFRRHETTVDPLRPERASQLATYGPFRITRNPMYVGMAGVLLANAAARRSIVGLVPNAGFVLLSTGRRSMPRNARWPPTSAPIGSGTLPPRPGGSASDHSSEHEAPLVRRTRPHCVPRHERLRCRHRRRVAGPAIGVPLRSAVTPRSPRLGGRGLGALWIGEGRREVQT